MARNASRFARLQRERNRQKKREDRAQRKALRREQNRAAAGENGEDPDIAGIIPGPQPKPWDDDDVMPADSSSPDETS